jgi:hypothetical protein
MSIKHILYNNRENPFTSSRDYSFNMESTTRIESITWLDQLPTEIIFTIFDYFSNNDIYTFFHLSQRLNYLLIENQRYLDYLELPRTNLDTWKNIYFFIYWISNRNMKYKFN